MSENHKNANRRWEDSTSHQYNLCGPHQFLRARSVQAANRFICSIQYCSGFTWCRTRHFCSPSASTAHACFALLVAVLYRVVSIGEARNLPCVPFIDAGSEVSPKFTAALQMSTWVLFDARHKFAQLRRALLLNLHQNGLHGRTRMVT